MSEHPGSTSSAASDPDWKAAYNDMRQVADNYAQQIKLLTNQLTFMQHAFLEKTHENSNSSTFAVAARPTLKETQKVVPSPRNGLLVKPKANPQIATQKSMYPVEEDAVKESTFDQVSPPVGDEPVALEGTAAHAEDGMQLSATQSVADVRAVARLDTKKIQD
jgi:hypothetical protein